jgi:hypothetical protein
MSEQQTDSHPSAPHAVPSDQPPSAVPGSGPSGATGEAPDEASRQAVETIRSISRLEESN